MNRRSINVDWLTVGLYLFFVFFGWINVYAASVRDPNISIFNVDYNYGKQFIFIPIALLIGGVILLLDTKFTQLISYLAYGATIALLMLVLVVGRDVNGARAWIDLGGPFKVQPAEFAKIGTAMAVAAFMTRYNFSLKRTTDQLGLAALILVPAGLIMLSPIPAVRW